ncbi:hypothetical protein A6J66_004020 [Yersinia enterocolitica]|nr:hypothetical protein A6J66_004020 [Yersinia enterocolitica]
MGALPELNRKKQTKYAMRCAYIDIDSLPFARYAIVFVAILPYTGARKIDRATNKCATIPLM